MSSNYLLRDDNDTMKMIPNPISFDENASHIIVILGMHRSGTSAITRALKALGVSLGDNLYPAAVDNPKGFWEDRDCIQINQELLRHLGSAYDGLDLTWQFSRSDSVISGLRVRAAEILKQNLLMGGDLWGFKDPRTCRLLEFWRPIMTAAGYKVTFVLAVRNPISVVRSLERRNQIPAEKGYLLWLQHVVPAVLSSAGSSRRIVVDYDQMMERPLTELKRMADVLGLALDPSQDSVTEFTKDFLDDSLRHTQFSVAELSLDSRVPNSIVQSYRLLLEVAKDRLSIDSEDFQSHFLDVANILKNMSPAFSYANMLELERDSLARTVSAHTEILSKTEDAVQFAEQQIATQRASAEASEQQVAIEQARTEAKELQRAAQQSRAEAAEQQVAIERARAEAKELQRAAQQSRAEAAEQQVTIERARAEAEEQYRIVQTKRAEAAEGHVKGQQTLLQTVSHQLSDTQNRQRVLELSTSWRATAPLRSVLRAHPRLAHVTRLSVKLLWWSLTLQLLRKLRDRRAYQRENATNIASLPASEMQALPLVAFEASSDLRDTVRERTMTTIWFDQDWYAAQDGGRAVADYTHFITYGAAEGRFPSALVEHIMQWFAPGVRFTLQIYESLVEASANWHGKLPQSSLWLLTFLFVPEWHDKATTPLEASFAYLRDGLAAGTPPGPLFDPELYRTRASTAGLPRLSPEDSSVVHWLLYGQSARIVPTDRFEEAFYRGSNPDIDASPLWGFAHFIQSGVYEGRLPKALRTFKHSQPAVRHGDASKLHLYHHWHALDFPNSPPARLDGVPAAYERRLDEFLRSDQLAQIFAAAQAIDPSVGEASSINDFLLPPFHDSRASLHAEVRRRLPETHYDSILCVPWIRTGGADLVAGLLAKALLRIRPDERVLILRTDQPHFERTNWLPTEADCVDISDLTRSLPSSVAEDLLRVLFRGLTVNRVFNVNSRLCWTTLQNYGANLSANIRTYAYMFCWDQTLSGLRAGYPAEFFAGTAGEMTAFLTDTVYLREELVKMYQLPASVGKRIVPIFTPAQSRLLKPSIARTVFERANPKSRRLVLWAGRLDRQKRFDLLQEIAQRMPDVEFHCWGAALLDAPPDLSRLPANVTMQGSFDSFDDLPLAEAGAWLFTALWEGMPTTIIELATRGVPIVASAVGGVPELIQVDTGWPVSAEAGPDGYVTALRDALSSPEEAVRRAERLQCRVKGSYTEAVYDATLEALLAAEGSL